MNAYFPFEDPEKQRAALRELGEPESEVERLAPSLAQLGAWEVRVDPASTQDLLARLLPELPQPSPVREAIAARWDSPWAQLVFFLEIARAQVSLLRPAFWLFSLFITVLGAVLTISELHLSQTLALWLLAPILAVSGVHYGFQSSLYRVNELEAVCPISPLRLALARLWIILSYNIVLLGSLTVFFASTGASDSLGQMVVHWLAPLLFVCGAALALSLRLALRPALSCAYGLWMVFVLAAGSEVTPLLLQAELGVLALGAGLAAFSLAGQKRAVVGG